MRVQSIIIACALACVPAQAQVPLQDQVYKAISSVNPSVMEIRGPRGLGSGIYVGDGYIITNRHVVSRDDGGDETGHFDEHVAVNPVTRMAFPVEIVHPDPSVDYAILKIRAPLRDITIKAATFGNSDNLHEGEFVLAIGSPLGYAQSFSFGIVSGLFRYFISNMEQETPNYREVYIMCDAAINKGNSGGPLVNMRGEVIGINTLREIEQISDHSFSASGMNFAIPINMILPALTSIKEGRTPSIPILGIDPSDVSTDIDPVYIERNKLSPNALQFRLVNGNGPLGMAGVRDGDILDEVNGRRLGGMAHLLYTLGSSKIGDVITMRLFRISEGRTFDVPVKVGRRIEEASLDLFLNRHPFRDMSSGGEVASIGIDEKSLIPVTDEDGYVSTLAKVLMYTESSAIWIMRRNASPQRVACP